MIDNHLKPDLFLFSGITGTVSLTVTS